MTVLTIYITVSFFFPRLSVSSAEPLNPKQAMETPFIIANDGVTPIWDIAYSYAILSLKTDDGLTITGSKKSRLNDITKAVSFMWPTEKYTVLFPLQAFQISPPSFVDMGVVVKYRPLPFIPYTREQSFRFMTRKASDGQLNWYPQPMAMKLDDD